MSQPFYKDKKFIKLNDEWRKKLKKSGFQDIEDEDENIDRGSWDFRMKRVQRIYRTKSEYYYMATQFLNDYKFESVLEKTIWTYHAEGVSVRDIVKLLNELKLSKYKHWSSVHIILQKLEAKMYEMYNR